MANLTKLMRCLLGHVHFPKLTGRPLLKFLQTQSRNALIAELAEAVCAPLGSCSITDIALVA